MGWGYGMGKSKVRAREDGLITRVRVLLPAFAGRRRESSGRQARLYMLGRSPISTNKDELTTLAGRWGLRCVHKGKVGWLHPQAGGVALMQFAPEGGAYT